MKPRMQDARGFTLIELMVTVAVAAVLMLVAIPALTTFKRNAELTSATNTLLASLNAARGEAMKRGMSSMLMPSDSSNLWKNGWRVFVDANSSRTYNTSDVTVSLQPALPSYFTVSGTGTGAGSTPYVLFDPSGYSKDTSGGFNTLVLTIARNDVSGTQANDETRRIIISTSGRIRSCKPTSSSDTSCATTSAQ